MWVGRLGVLIGLWEQGSQNRVMGIGFCRMSSYSGGRQQFRLLGCVILAGDLPG